MSFFSEGNIKLEQETQFRVCGVALGCCGMHLHDACEFQQCIVASASTPSDPSLLAPSHSPPRTGGLGTSHSNASYCCPVQTPPAHVLGSAAVAKHIFKTN